MIGIILQFINNNFVSLPLLESIVLDIFMGILMFILTTIPNTLNHHLDVSKVKKERQICGGLLILLVFMMSCVFSTLDNAVTFLHATGEVNIEEFPRVLLALSGLLGGILFDFKDRVLCHVIINNLYCCFKVFRVTFNRFAYFLYDIWILRCLFYCEFYGDC